MTVSSTSHAARDVLNPTFQKAIGIFPWRTRPAVRYSLPMSSLVDLHWVPKLPPDQSVCPDPVVWVDVARLDEAWRGDDGYYIGFGGHGSSKSRYAGAGERLARGLKTWMPEICLGTSGMITFSDGRHRFAWCRDHGVEALPVGVCRECENEVRQGFGTERRVSQAKILT